MPRLKAKITAMESPVICKIVAADYQRAFFSSSVSSR